MKKQTMLLAILSGMFTYGETAPDPQPKLDSAVPVLSSSPLRIATVDMMLLYDDFYQTNLARQEFNIDNARIQKDNNDKLTSIRQVENDLRLLQQQSEDPSLSDQKKAQVYKDYNYKLQMLKQLDKERIEYIGRKKQALQEKTATRTRAILDEIRKLVEVHAKAENYDYVFDKSGVSTSQVPILLYSKDATDITALLLQELHKNAPADFSTTNSAPDLAPIIEIPDMKR